MSKIGKTILFRVAVIRTDEKHAPTADKRRRVNYTLAEYADSDGNRYRKAFRSYAQPLVPDSGTHDELNALAYQGAELVGELA